MSNSNLLKRSQRVNVIATQRLVIAFEDRSLHLLGQLAGILSLRLQGLLAVLMQRKPMRNSNLLESRSRIYNLAPHGCVIVFSNHPLLRPTQTKLVRLTLITHIYRSK